ncbi:MAG: hypothetical protein WCO55_06275 [Candidatus Falkowbacteria bacterium]
MEIFFESALICLAVFVAAHFVFGTFDYVKKKKLAGFMADVVKHGYQIGELKVSESISPFLDIWLAITVEVSESLSFKQFFTLTIKDVFMLKEALPASNGLGYIAAFLDNDPLVQQMNAKVSFKTFCKQKVMGKRDGLKLLGMYKKAYAAKSGKQPLANHAL